MKRFILIFAVLMLTVVVKAQDFWTKCESGQTLYYKIIDKTNNYVAIVYPGYDFYAFPGYHPQYAWEGFTTPAGDIIIPSNVTYKGINYTVTAIGDNAFMDCKSLTDIIIPNSVKHIGYNAFNGSGLVSVTIPESVECVSDGAFSNCNDLTLLTIESPETNMMCSVDEGGAIYDCPNLTIVLSTTHLKLEAGNYSIEIWDWSDESSSGNPTYRVIVPCGMAETYKNSDWGEVFVFKENCEE